jgi:hypothetical protein
MHDTEQADARAAVQLRADRYDAFFAAIGCEDDREIANRAGYTDRTIRRARNGQLGEVFIANTLHTLTKHGLTVTFDELFTVTEKRAA